MADYWALSAGDWSNVSNWLTGTTPGEQAGELPGPLDDVYANNRTIVIDIDPVVNLITTAAKADVARAGGGFRINSGVSLSASVSAGTTTCLTFLSTTPNFCTIVGNITGSSVSSNIYGVLNSSSGTIIISGDTIGGFLNGSSGTLNNSRGTIIIYGNARGTLGNRAAGANNNSSGNITVHGNVRGSTGPRSYGASNNSTGTFVIYGSVLGGNNGDNAYGVVNESASTGNITIYGPVSGGQGSGAHNGVRNINTGSVFISGTVYGSNGVGAVNQGQGSMVIEGDVYGQSSTGIDNTGLGTVTIQGDVFGGDSSNARGVLNLNGLVYIFGNSYGGRGSNAHGSLNTGQGSITVTRAVGSGWGIGSTVEAGFAAGIGNTNLFGACYVEELSTGPRGSFPTTGSNIYIIRKPSNKSTFLGVISSNPTTIESPSSIVMYTSLSGEPGTIAPLVSNVRSGTTYDFNSLTGTCVIPIPITVLSGTVYDFDTVGTFFTNLERAWQTQLNALSTQNSFGRRLKDIITLSAVSNTEDNVWTISE